MISTLTTETLASFVLLNQKNTLGLYASFDGVTKKMLMTAKCIFLKLQILHHLAVLLQLFLFWLLRRLFQTVVTHFCVWKSKVLSGSSVASKQMLLRIEKLDYMP